MKNKNILYWIITGLFAAFMLFTAIPDVMMSASAVTFIMGLGYPKYLVPFLGIAKVLGSITICLPGFNKLKEWAYAGLFFDLLGATWSVIKTGGLNLQIIFMLLPILFLFLSYYLWHRKMNDV